MGEYCIKAYRIVKGENMFNFLENWDPILVDFKRDIDGLIKEEI